MSDTPRTDKANHSETPNSSDPLAEMWRELAEYQEQADRDGHGESWQAMCREKTQAAVWKAAWESAWYSARDAAREAAQAVAWAAARRTSAAAMCAQRASAEIRRAKEVKR